MNKKLILVLIGLTIIIVGLSVFRSSHPADDLSPVPALKLTPEMNSFISGMPKTALHMHLEGSLEPEMAFANAQKYKMLPLKVPKAGGGTMSVTTLDDLKKVYNFKDLESFLNVYNLLATTLKKKEDFTALAYAYCKKAMSENIKHAEIFFDPQTHTARGLPFAEVVDGIQDGLERGRKEGMSIHLISSFLRDHSVGSASDTDDINKAVGKDPTAWTTVKQAVAYNSTTQKPGGSPGGRNPSYFIVGMGLDNNEVGFSPELFVDVYAYGRKNGMFAVAHGGEEGPPAYIWQCINKLKCIRIDHAVRAVEDPYLVSYMSTPQTKPEIIQFFQVPHLLPATVCPLSNYKLDVFPDPTRTNIVEMLDLGIMATVNSDDPAYFGGYVTENYIFLLKSLNSKSAKGRPLDLADIRRIAINGFLASVLPMDEKLQYISSVNNYFLQDPGTLYKSFSTKYKNKGK